MSSLCIGFTYYNDVRLLVSQLNTWYTYPEEAEIILVDDASKQSAAKVLQQYNKIVHPGLKVYQVEQDLGFNSHGCRNLIAQKANADNLCLLDIDCLMMYNDFNTVANLPYNYNERYIFYGHRCFDHFHMPHPGHVNAFSMSKETFWSVGGYDESWTGIHWGDREFFQDLWDNGCVDVEVDATVLMLRDGKKVVNDPALTQAYYTEDTLYQPPPPKKEEVAGRIKSKVNFEYTRIL